MIAENRKTCRCNLINQLLPIFYTIPDRFDFLTEWPVLQVAPTGLNKLIPQYFQLTDRPAGAKNLAPYNLFQPACPVWRDRWRGSQIITCFRSIDRPLRWGAKGLLK